MQKRLKSLLEKYSIDKNVVLKDSSAVTIDGKDYPLLPWRSQRRFQELKALVTEGAICGISVMRTLRIVPRGSDLYQELYREFDLAQYILGGKICEIFAVGSWEHALNLIVKFDGGYLCTLEVAATLSEGMEIIDKHEIIAASGVACDRVADTLIPQESVYVYGQGKRPSTYTDVDAELFGLDAEACAVVRNAFEVAKTMESYEEDVKELAHLLECTRKSLACAENILV